MAQEKYLKLSHFKPDGYPEIYPGSSDEVKALMPYLIKTVSQKWTKIPNHDLEVLASRNMDVPCLGFRKSQNEVYVHIFCNEFMNPLFAMQIVINLYKKFNLGKPVFTSAEPNWIHTIPLPGPKLTQQETLLTYQLTQSLFWTIFMDYKRSNGGTDNRMPYYGI